MTYTSKFSREVPSVMTKEKIFKKRFAILTNKKTFRRETDNLSKERKRKERGGRGGGVRVKRERKGGKEKKGEEREGTERGNKRGEVRSMYITKPHSMCTNLQHSELCG